MLQVLCVALILSGTVAQYGPPKQLGPKKHRTTTTTQVPPPASNEILPSTYVESGSLPNGGNYEIQTSTYNQPGFKGQSTTFVATSTGNLPAEVNIAKNPFLMAALSGNALPPHPGVSPDDSQTQGFKKPGSQYPSTGLHSNPFLSGDIRPQQKPSSPQEPQRVSGCESLNGQTANTPVCPSYHGNQNPGFPTELPQQPIASYPLPHYPNKQTQQPGFPSQQAQVPGKKPQPQEPSVGYGVAPTQQLETTNPSPQPGFLSPQYGQPSKFEFTHQSSPPSHPQPQHQQFVPPNSDSKKPFQSPEYQPNPVPIPQDGSLPSGFSSPKQPVPQGYGHSSFQPQLNSQRPGFQSPGTFSPQQPTYELPETPKQPQEGGFPNSGSQRPGHPELQTGGPVTGSNPPAGVYAGSGPTGPFPQPQLGQSCSGENHYCVPELACKNGLFNQQGNYYNKEKCNPGEVCCKASQPSYGVQGSTEGPVTKYTGPLNTTPPPGCAAALKCVPEIYCDVEGVMQSSPVGLTREQYEQRVPLTDCQNMDTGILGKCCRDPNYKDPWPAGMMMNKAPDQFDDGLYRPDKYPGNGGPTVPASLPDVTANAARPPVSPHESSYSQNSNGSPSLPVPHSVATIAPPNPYTIKQPLGVFGGNVTPFPVAPKPGQTHAQVFPKNEDKPYGGEFLPEPDFEFPTSSGQTNPTPNETPHHSLPKPDSLEQPLTRPSNPTSFHQPDNRQPAPFPSYGQPQSSQAPSEQSQPTFAQLPSFSQPSHSQHTSNVGGSSGPVSPGEESCGVRRPASSASSDETGFGEFPWQATILSAYNNSATCSGAIIAPNAVLTAAHCIQGSRPEELFVRVGSWRLGQDTPKPSQTRTAAATAVHPVYNQGSLVKDQAVIVTNEPFDFDEHVDRVCLPLNSPSGGYTAKTSNCFITGWGRPVLQSNVPGAILHKVPVKLVQKPECENSLKQNLGKYFILNDGFTCVSPVNEAELCKVDSGSPLVCDRGDGHYELVGVYSWDTKCTSAIPGVTAGCDSQWINKILSTPVDKLREEQDAQVSVYSTVDDANEKPGFALGYGK